MPEWTTYLLLIGGLIVGLAILNHRNPQKVNAYWKAATITIVLGAFWFWQERLAAIGATFGYSWVLSLALLMLIAFVVWGAYTRKPAL